MKFLRGLPLADGANRRKLPERLCTWPHGHRTSLPVLRFVSMAVMRSDDMPIPPLDVRTYLPCSTWNIVRTMDSRYPTSYSWLIFAKNSLFDPALASRSISSSIASTGDKGFSTLRSTQMRCKSSLGTDERRVG